MVVVIGGDANTLHVNLIEIDHTNPKYNDRFFLGVTSLLLYIA